MYVFVSMSHDYADEFDVNCCFVAAKAEFNKNMSIIELAFDANILGEDDEYYFGTNEYLAFDCFDSFEWGVKSNDCSEEFYHEFINLAGHGVGYNVMERMIERATERAAELKEEEAE